MYLFTVRWFGGYDQIRSDIRSLLMLTYCYAALIVIAEPSALTNVTHYHMYCIYISNCLDRSNIFLTCRRKINYNRYLFFFSFTLLSYLSQTDGECLLDVYVQYIHFLFLFLPPLYRVSRDETSSSIKQAMESCA